MERPNALRAAEVAQQRRRRCIGIVGYSGVGKTTLLELLVPVLQSRGRVVACIKHASHGFRADQPGKDSHRLYEAGSAAVALISDAQLVTFARRPTHDAGSALDLALVSLPAESDLVLVEGFHWESIPRVVIARAARSPASQFLEAGPVLRVLPSPSAPQGRAPVFGAPLVRSLAETIDRRVPRPPACDAAVEPARAAGSELPPLAPYSARSQPRRLEHEV